jgi:hypothetical protein
MIREIYKVYTTVDHIGAFIRKVFWGKKYEYGGHTHHKKDFKGRQGGSE